MIEMVALLVQCAGDGCTVEFAPVRGKRFCSGACRARASLKARYIPKPVKRRPEMTVKRRALRKYAAWLEGRMA